MDRPAVIFLLCAACGGTAVIDGGGSDGGSAGSDQGGNGTGNSSTGGNCDELRRELNMALEAALACDSCDDGPDPCVYLSGQELRDSCGCLRPVNSGLTDAISVAVAASRAWRSAGCQPGPRCDTDCSVSGAAHCESTGACPGMCF